nr:aryl-sulfate sulfotransferase N-terminal domain-containing protein [Limosilactobacillus ingluviei]
MDKSAKTSITNTVNGGYQRVYQVPVVGLYADYANQVKIKVTYRNGQTTTKNLDPPNREITENAQPGRYQGHQIRSK